MTQIIKGITGEWEIVVGLEIHAQVISLSKLFSGSPTDFGAEPNTNVSFFDAGMPGTLPVINGKCVEQAVRTGLGLDAKVNLSSIFDRKNYFYPDLPSGYQISQFNHPIIGKGVVTIAMQDGYIREVGITRIHLEQDAGKSIHDQSPTESFIDLNRAGVALMEIVSEPDIRSSLEAAEFVKKLRSILRYLGTCDGDMEKGSMRCDANVSVRRVGETKYGTRAEVKNVNSVKNLIRAIDFEAERQVFLLESGGQIKQETRLFDANMNETRSMRSKEEAYDYRYFPDPDLLPLNLTEEYVNEIKKSLPELPDEKIKRYTQTMGLSLYDSCVLVAEKATADFFEELAAKTDPKLAANWITGELFSYLNKAGKSIENLLISVGQLAELIRLIQDETISGKIAKQVFEILIEEGGTPKNIVESKGLRQLKDDSEIINIIDKVVLQNKDKVIEYQNGKDKLFGFFVGQVMKLSEGKANPQMVNEFLIEKLNRPLSKLALTNKVQGVYGAEDRNAL
jgi:aspartyl-tRNA(Asn)/glutamyl-tRNA(Gln) amidotransferase subunit B